MLVVSAEIRAFSFTSEEVNPIEFSAFSSSISLNHSSVEGSENLRVDDSDKRWAISLFSWVACEREFMESVASASVYRMLSRSLAIVAEMLKLSLLLYREYSISVSLLALTSFITRLDSFCAMTAAVNPAVAIEDTPIAVATTIGTDTTKRLSLGPLAVAVPFC